MVAAVETMAYAGQTPWHGLGFKVSEDLTPQEIAVAAKIDWTLSKRQVYFKRQSGHLEVAPDEFCVVRDHDEQFYCTVGASWKILQNLEAIEFFTKFVQAGKMRMETAGALWGGRYIWALARIGKDFKIGRSKDEIHGYLLMAIPHLFGKAMVFKLTPIRVVCWNTYSWALGTVSGAAYKVAHCTKFDEATKKKVEEALGLAAKEMADFQNAATLLAKAKAPAQEVEDFFCEILQFDPKQAAKNKDGSIREPAALERFRTALTHAPGQQLSTALGTWWGAFNAVTFVADHQIPSDDADLKLKNSWFGHYSNLKTRAFELAVKAAA